MCYFLEIVGTAQEGSDSEPASKRQRLVYRQPCRRVFTRNYIREDNGCGTFSLFLSYVLLDMQWSPIPVLGGSCFNAREVEFNTRPVAVRVRGGKVFSVHSKAISNQQSLTKWAQMFPCVLFVRRRRFTCLCNTILRAPVSMIGEPTHCHLWFPLLMT